MGFYTLVGLVEDVYMGMDRREGSMGDREREVV